MNFSVYALVLLSPWPHLIIVVKMQWLLWVGISLFVPQLKSENAFTKQIKKNLRHMRHDCHACLSKSVRMEMDCWVEEYKWLPPTPPKKKQVTKSIRRHLLKCQLKMRWIDCGLGETQVDLQIENKLLSTSSDIVSVRSGWPTNQYSHPFKKKIANGSHASS